MSQALGRLKTSRKLFGIFAIIDALLLSGGVVRKAVMFAKKFFVFEVPHTVSGLFGRNLAMRELLTNELQAFVQASFTKSSFHLQIHCIFYKKNIYSN